MTVVLFILAAVLWLTPTIALAIAIPRLGDLPDPTKEQS